LGGSAARGRVWLGGNRRFFFGLLGRLWRQVLDGFQTPFERVGNRNDLINISLLHQRGVVVFENHIEQGKDVVARHGRRAVDGYRALDLRIENDGGNPESVRNLIDELIEISVVVTELDLVGGEGCALDQRRWRSRSRHDHGRARNRLSPRNRLSTGGGFLQGIPLSLLRLLRFLRLVSDCFEQLSALIFRHLGKWPLLRQVRLARGSESGGDDRDEDYKSSL
jgi:hypothetical protein